MVENVDKIQIVIARCCINLTTNNSSFQVRKITRNRSIEWLLTVTCERIKSYIRKRKNNGTIILFISIRVVDFETARVPPSINNGYHK